MELNINNLSGNTLEDTVHRTATKLQVQPYDSRYRVSFEFRISAGAYYFLGNWNSDTSDTGSDLSSFCFVRDEDNRKSAGRFYGCYLMPIFPLSGSAHSLHSTNLVLSVTGKNVKNIQCESWQSSEEAVRHPKQPVDSLCRARYRLQACRSTFPPTLNQDRN